ncbi:MAG: hypothetical protein ACREXS_06690 [Gammaproteobacteria bacterium]
MPTASPARPRRPTALETRHDEPRRTSIGKVVVVALEHCGHVTRRFEERALLAEDRVLAAGRR